MNSNKTRPILTLPSNRKSSRALTHQKILNTSSALCLTEKNSKNSFLDSDDRSTRLLTNSNVNIKDMQRLDLEFASTYENDNKDKEILQQRDINTIKKLNFWEREHLEKKETTQSLFNSLAQVQNNEYIPFYENESMNSLAIIKDNLLKLNFKNTNKILENFINRYSKEQGSIYLNNVTKTKHKFNFNIFIETTEKEIGGDLQVDMKDIRIIQMQEAKAEYYREVIREKCKLEMQSRAELMKVAQRIFEKKVEKQAIEKILNEAFIEFSTATRELGAQLETMKNEYVFLKKESERMNRNEANNTFNIANMLTVSNITTSLNKRIPIRSPMQEERMLQEREYRTNANKIEEKIKQYESGISQHTKHFTRLADENKRRLDNLIKEIAYLKQLSLTITKDQRVYYLDILKRGIDVRNEGLMWAVKRLIELDAHLEYSLFPKFLDHQQIDYLKNLAQLSLESSQLKIVLKCLKTRQKKIREEENIDRMIKLTTYTQKFYPTASDRRKIFSDFSQTPGNPNATIERINRTFEKIYKKYQIIMKQVAERRLEDLQIQSIVKGLKEQLLDYATGRIKHVEAGDPEENIIKYFMENEKQREYIEEILLVRARIKKIDDTITEMIKEELRNFKKRYDYVKTSRSAKSSMYYDLLYAALFGNNSAL